jgi:hypothetical protein
MGLAKPVGGVSRAALTFSLDRDLKIATWDSPKTAHSLAPLLSARESRTAIDIVF